MIAAERLNPTATLAQLSLDSPSGLFKQCDHVWSRLLSDVEARLESTEESANRTYFYSSSTHEWIPKRAGYCVGYRLVKAALKTRSLKELMHQTPAQALSTLKQAIVTAR